MDCRILRAVTLKSNGRLSCDDSAGYQIEIGSVSPSRHWSFRQTVNAPIYRHIRNSFADGRLPWPDVCPGCDLLNRGAPPNDTLDTEIAVQVEPTLYCTLRCPSCHRREETKLRTGGWYLDPAVFRAFVAGCLRDGVRIREIDYLGWGEPFDHPALGEMLATVNELSPDTHQTVTTHGNLDYDTLSIDARLDRLVVSCDGIRQRPYELYRRNGDVERVVRFIRRAARPHAARARFVQWKYILFDHNDDEADLVAVQRIAEEAGVDEVLFILTNSPERSKRFDAATVDDFPFATERARLDLAPALQKTDRVVHDLAIDRAESCGAIRFDVDRLTAREGRLVVEGWACDAAGRPIAGVACPSPAGGFAPVRHQREPRPDVEAALDVARPLGLRFQLPTDTLGRFVSVRLATEDAAETVDLLLPPDLAGERMSRDVSASPRDGEVGGIRFNVDRASMHGRRLLLEGWAASGEGGPVDDVRLVGADEAASAPVALFREERRDVWAAWPAWPRRRHGLRLYVDLPPGADHAVFAVHAGGERADFRVDLPGAFLETDAAARADALASSEAA